jgi:hypothetical protein
LFFKNWLMMFATQLRKDFQKRTNQKIQPVPTCAFIPESSDKLLAKAGLLTYFYFYGLPAGKCSGCGTKSIK